MENAASEDDFLEALEDEGVTARYGTSKRYGKYISYELVDVPAHMEGVDRKYKARSYTLGDAYGVEALREKLREKAKEQLRMVEQRNNITEHRAVLPDIPQRGLSVEAAAWPPINETPEMKCVPGIKLTPQSAARAGRSGQKRLSPYSPPLQRRLRQQRGTGGQIIAPPK